MKNKLIIILLLLALIFIGVKFLKANEQTVYINENIEIVIDPGHGGNDPGTTSVSGKFEKDINLQIAEKLFTELQKMGYGVVLTRTDDEYLKHMDRVNMANLNKAKLFISVHCNATENDESINGLQVLYFPSDSSKKLAGIMQTNIIDEADMYDLGIVERGDLIVLNQTTMPAIIIETGFLSNYKEADKLEKKSYQKKLVKGIINGIEEYYYVQGW